MAVLFRRQAYGSLLPKAPLFLVLIYTTFIGKGKAAGYETRLSEWKPLS